MIRADRSLDEPGLGGLARMLILIASALAGCGTDAEPPAGPVPAGIDSSATALRAVFADRQLQEAVQLAAGGPDSLLTLDRAARLTRLDAGGRGIASLAGIDQLSGLEVLILRDNRIGDLSPLSALAGLRYLDLENNQVTSLAPLAGLARLEGVILDHNLVADASPLLGLTALRTVGLRGNPLDPAGLVLVRTALTSRGAQVDVEGGTSADSAAIAAPVDTTPAAPISPFVDAGLESIVRWELGIKAPRPLTQEDLESLTELNATNQSIRDLSGIEALARLESLVLTGPMIRKQEDGRWIFDSTYSYSPVGMANQVRDLRPLAKLARLKRLHLAFNPIEDLSPLAELKLTHLTFGGCRVDDLSPLAGLQNLTFLAFSWVRVTDLHPLQGLSHLSYLSIDHSQIRDLTPLAGLSLVYAELRHNLIEDISPLLRVTGTVSLTGNPLSRESLEVHIPALQARGVTVYLTE